MRSAGEGKDRIPFFPKEQTGQQPVDSEPLRLKQDRIPTELWKAMHRRSKPPW